MGGGDSNFFVFKRSELSFLRKLRAFFASGGSGDFLESTSEFTVCGGHGKEIMSGKVGEMPVAHRIVFSTAFMAGSALVTVAGKIGFWIIALSVLYFVVASKKRTILFSNSGEALFTVASQRRVFLKERYVIEDAAGELLGSVRWRWSLKDPAGFWTCLDKEGRDVFEMRASNPSTDSRFSLFRCDDGTVAGKISPSKQEIILRLKGNRERLDLLFCMVAVAFRPF